MFLKFNLYFLIIFPYFVLAQSFKQDFSSVVDHLKKSQTINHINNDTLPENQNNYRAESEIKLLANFSIGFYQNYISSQDMSYCNFSPSCSNFSRQSFRHRGFIKGLLLTSDRLQRCNGGANFTDLYLFDAKQQKFLDPVISYFEY